MVSVSERERGKEGRRGGEKEQRAGAGGRKRSIGAGLIAGCRSVGMWTTFLEPPSPPSTTKTKNRLAPSWDSVGGLWRDPGRRPYRTSVLGPSERSQGQQRTAAKAKEKGLSWAVGKRDFKSFVKVGNVSTFREDD